MAGNSFKVFLNQNLVSKSEANVNLNTVAFKYAAMVFEGIRAYWNEEEAQLFVFRLSDHARRLEESTRAMRMDTKLTHADFSRAVLQLLDANAVRENVHVRQMVYVDGEGEMSARGPISHAVVVTPKGGWFPNQEAGIHACISSWQRITDYSMPPRIKCAANYQNGRLALLQAQLDGYDCAILLTSSGKVAEEARGCVFMVRNCQVVTPRITDSILESITRDTLITLFRDLWKIDVIQRDVDRTELYLAQEIFICGSGLEVLPIASIDRHQIGNGRPGELTKALREAYFKVVWGKEPSYKYWLTPVYAKHPD